MAKTKKIKVKKKPPVILVLLLTICIIPCAILGAVLFQSLEDSSKPVVGSRYEGALDPAITEDQLTQIKTTLEGFSGVESVEVNLKTARLAVLINTNDDVNRDGIYLAGGGSLINGMDKLISEYTGTAVHTLEDPTHSVVRGAAIALRKPELLKHVNYQLRSIKELTIE